MITSRHIEKIVAVIVAVAVILCMLAAMFSDTLSETLGITLSDGYTMEYESKLFDTSSVIEIDIQIDENDWSNMLENAINEEYYRCNVVINGETFYNVGIRPKGNTSLSQVASSDSDRYSFKLEFGQYVDGQTCYGLGKLVLNNSFADATNMKEAVVYDMFQKLGADASLYNYADVSVNGETWGVYLALEAVEESFMLRNYGTEDGELYKPDSMNFGGAGGMKNMSEDELNEAVENFFGNSEMEAETSSEASDETAEETASAFPSRGGRGQFGGDMQNANPFENMPQMNGSAPPENSGGEMQGGFAPNGEMPDMGNMPEMGGMPGQSENGEMPSMPDMSNFEDMFENGEMPDMGDFGGGKGGFGSGGGSDLNYTDDSTDSYSSIWEGEVTSTSNSDHERVVEALKNISEQNNVEDYLDVDNMLRYMAVHTFAVNLDSLSGSMTHNYYLYEQDGMLNLLPWDYNLSFGGFSMGSRGGSGATDTVNFAIDTPFSSGISLEDRQIFAAILENEEYLEQYHEYLRILCEEYVDGGELEALYNRIRSQIDTLVENDPTAFYSYDEYDTAAQTLMEVIALRSESIKGQLNGSIPSTNDGQNADSSSLVDASHIDLGTMGSMNMGGSDRGGMSGRFNMQPSDEAATDGSAQPESPSAEDTTQTVSDGSSAQTEAPASDENISPPSENIPQSDGADGFSAAGGKPSSLTDGSESSEERFSRGGMPSMSPDGSSSFDSSSLIWLGISLAAIAAGIIFMAIYKRRRK